MKLTTSLLGATALCAATAAHAVDLEVTHWWTSGGEANAVAKFAEALNATGTHTWVDGAIAGSGDTARPIMISVGLARYLHWALHTSFHLVVFLRHA